MAKKSKEKVKLFTLDEFEERAEDIEVKIRHETSPIPQGLTKDKLKRLLGRQLSSRVTDGVMELIKNMEADTDLDQDSMEERVVSYISIMQEMKVSMTQYVNAVKYCVLKRNLRSNKKAYEIVFPDRVAAYEAEVKRRAEAGEPAMKVTLDTKVSNYNSGDLVVRIDQMMAVEWSLLHYNDRENALYTLINLSKGKAAPAPDGSQLTVTPMVQMQAASKVVDILAPAEEKAAKLDINVSSGIQQNLAEQLAKMTEIQMAKLKSGSSIEDIQQIGLNSDTIDAEVIDE